MSSAGARRTPAKSLSLNPQNFPRRKRRRHKNPSLSRSSLQHSGQILSCVEKTRKRFARRFHSALPNLTTSGAKPEDKPGCLLALARDDLRNHPNENRAENL